MITLLFFEHPPQPYNEVAEKLGLARGSIGFIRGRCLKRLKTNPAGEGLLMQPVIPPLRPGQPGRVAGSGGQSAAPAAAPDGRARLLEAETVGRFYDEVVRRMHVDIPQAERMARSAAWLSGRLGRRRRARRRTARPGPHLRAQAPVRQALGALRAGARDLRAAGRRDGGRRARSTARSRA